MTDQATISTTDLYEWAKCQGNLGVAVLYTRAFENGKLNDQLVHQAIRVRDRQIADGKLTVAPSVRTERIFRRPPAMVPVVETSQVTTLVQEDGSILPEQPKRENPWPGMYTVETEDGHVTFRVHIQPSDSKFAPGATVISLLTGRDNTGDYTSFGFLREGKLHPFKSFLTHTRMLDRANQFLADPDAALESKHCARCNRVLTTPESIAIGMGPECVKLGMR